MSRLMIEYAGKFRIVFRIIFSKYGFDEVDIDGETHYIVSEASILAVIK